MIIQTPGLWGGVELAGGKYSANGFGEHRLYFMECSEDF
jgi:hypothetical protein